MKPLFVLCYRYLPNGPDRFLTLEEGWEPITFNTAEEAHAYAERYTWPALAHEWWVCEVVHRRAA